MRDTEPARSFMLVDVSAMCRRRIRRRRSSQRTRQVRAALADRCRDRGRFGRWSAESTASTTGWRVEPSRDPHRRAIERRSNFEVRVGLGVRARLRIRTRLGQHVIPQEGIHGAWRWPPRNSPAAVSLIARLRSCDRLCFGGNGPIALARRRVLRAQGAIALGRRSSFRGGRAIALDDRRLFRSRRPRRLPRAGNDAGDEHDEHRGHSRDQRLMTARELLQLVDRARPAARRSVRRCR